MGTGVTVVLGAGKAICLDAGFDLGPKICASGVGFIGALGFRSS